MIPHEIERRFLLKAFPRVEADVRMTHIDQGYLDVPQSLDSVRVRIYGSGRAEMTIKRGVGTVREEYNQRLEPSFAQTLLDTCPYALAKMRFQYDGWEIDVYQEPLSGIVVAEHEYPSLVEAEQAEIPPWFPEHVEITDSITNLHLARLAADLKNVDASAPVHITPLLKKIPKIIITGGPCSGKSTIIRMLEQEFPQLHYVPEVATIIIAQLGIRPPSSALEEVRFQKTIFRTQRIFEATSLQYAMTQRKAGLILDRGTVDAVAYLKNGWTQFESTLHTTATQEYAQYDKVIYLGMPAQDVYDRERLNNPARSETFEQASRLAAGVREAWHKHPKFTAIDNADWDVKVLQVRKEIQRLLGAK